MQAGDYIAGRMEKPQQPEGELRVQSPADLSDEVGHFGYASSQAERAVEAARQAVRPWQRLGEARRRERLFAYRDWLRAHQAELARTIAREVGKALWDAETEARAMSAKVDLMLGEGATWTNTSEVSSLPGEIRHRPHGVMAVIGPFNFPGHLPNGQIVPALLLGNTVIFKPSDKAPTVGTWMARAMHECGFPPGVFQLVQGDARVAERLVAHPDVDGVLFTGSSAVGKKILRATAEQPGKMVALELGGKNASIVLEDAELERAARHIAFAAFASTGQRCTATSRVYVARSRFDELAERLCAAAEQAVVGYPLDAGVFMGPLVTDAARQALLRAQQNAQAAGFEALREGGALQVDGREGYYVRPSVHAAPDAGIVVNGYTHDELFGPDVALYPVDDLDQAIALTNGTRYGLAAAVFTESRERFEAAAERLEVGVLHWNRPSAGASGRLPFGGVKDSGNHRPAGILAGQLASYSQAVLLRPEAEGELPSWPGLFG